MLRIVPLEARFIVRELVEFVHQLFSVWTLKGVPGATRAYTLRLFYTRWKGPYHAYVEVH